MSDTQSKVRKEILDTVEPDLYKEGQSVDLIIKSETDLGYKAIVDGKYWGVLYRNEVFQSLERNQEMIGYIKKIREDGKIDLSLYQAGNADSDEIGHYILEKLKKSGGYLEINDKASPEIIYELFGVSKKKYKIALGGLYKKRLIEIKDDGIYLVKEHKSKS